MTQDTTPRVTEADRIMCARAVATAAQEHLKPAILRGDYDHTEAMKAFVEHRTAAEASAKAEIEALRRAVEMLRSYGCPRCNGDCGSANPPVIACPMRVAQEALLARQADGEGV